MRCSGKKKLDVLLFLESLPDYFKLFYLPFFYFFQGEVTHGCIKITDWIAVKKFPFCSESYNIGNGWIL